MNKFLILITSLLIIFSCKAQDEITNISKSCNDLKFRNLIYYQMCLDWNLSADNILEIIQNKHEEYLPNDVDFGHFYGFTPDSIYIKAELTKNNKLYDVLLDSESWFLLTEKHTDKSQLFSCRDPKISQYFIGDFVTEALVEQHPELEERYKQHDQTAINTILQYQPTTLKDFNGHYFSTNLTLTISDTKIKLNTLDYDLPLFLKEDDSIRAYQGLAKEQTQGNFIFTLFIKDKRYYFQSPDIMDNKIIEVHKKD
ncbi:hypothetical protein A9G35_01705 [Gilliamella sp. Choc5-1]|uniref:hypothetical protein n=1 Tax=Gilliamella sp. Choc5-1 TaxID=3120238 RepID=UPI00080E01B2|nr:hypothetical protein [Gilliamella apicola]OCG48453.1 hypothetical protein A9G35_01705 [Gilliamella apicola]